jgi:6-phosphogluconolactonase/glucosamine-6-phosphate isomerase/deaminase
VVLLVTGAAKADMRRAWSAVRREQLPGHAARESRAFLVLADEAAALRA